MINKDPKLLPVDVKRAILEALNEVYSGIKLARVSRMLLPQEMYIERVNEYIQQRLEAIPLQ